VKHLGEKTFLLETVPFSYIREVAIANSGELVIYYSREMLCGTSPTINVSICIGMKVAEYTIFFGALDERHLYLSDLTEDFIPNRPWWVVGSPEKG
jgi:hypothetical protein